ncbi:hypothetical protein FAGAP_5385 [Fusarium agapanthi]|uniref:CBM-cenC domain-containing protein n=1 Tax=Fusarium agapanthi TaxID=1803897 RepID=A0A9P5E710_9HYPO|nr:hypothetical protein FAGAP_5385 [Fusarium agapanthi]
MNPPFKRLSFFNFRLHLSLQSLSQHNRSGSFDRRQPTEGLTDITSDVPTTVGSTTVSSFGKTTAVASSSTYLSNEESSIIITESVSSTETSVDPKETSTTALSTTKDTTAEAATATATTTSSEATSAIPFISNAGFDDDDSSVAPWELYYDEFAVSIASDVKHDGRNSPLMAKTLGGRLLVDYIRQPLQGSITAGVTYTMSAWVNANFLCPAVTLIFSCQSNAWTDARPTDITATVDQWTYVSSTCTYTQEQIDSEGLYFMTEVTCATYPGQACIDTVDFSV